MEWSDALCAERSVGASSLTGPAISICGNRDLVPSEQRLVLNAGTINAAVQQLVAEVLMLQC